MSQPADLPCVSTGQLPEADIVRRMVVESRQQFVENTEGQNSPVYPALARADSRLFGVCLVDARGHTYQAGEANHPFAIMSVSKPFVFALACEALGHEEVRARVGVNATGRPFDSIEGVERGPGQRTNPMVNAGAIATTCLAPGDSPQAKWDAIQAGLNRFAGRELALNDEVYASAKATNFRNQAIAQVLKGYRQIDVDPATAVELYTRQCSLAVTAIDLAVMAATLADGGLNPLTRQQVISPETCHYALAVMATAGLYQNSGDWLYDVGMPGKSGIGGGLIAVSPGKAGLGTFAPPLDSAGNSVKGQLAMKFLSRTLGLDLLASRPQPSA